MTIGALPTVFSVFAGIAYTGRTYIAFLLVFAVGGLLFLMQDQVARSLDASSKAVPEAIYTTTLKFLGNVLVLFSVLSVFLHIVLAAYEEGWWVTPFVVLLYGLLLSWCTRGNVDAEMFKTVQMASAPAKARSPKKASTKKRRKKR